MLASLGSWPIYWAFKLLIQKLEKKKNSKQKWGFGPKKRRRSITSLKTQ
jgi:hypothetical protein